MNDRAIGYLLLAALLAVPIAVYVISKRRKAASRISRFGLILLSVLLGMVAYVGVVERWRWSGPLLCRVS